MTAIASTNDLTDAIRTRLLTTQNADGDTLEIHLALDGGAEPALYIESVPDDSDYPFGVMRLQNRDRTRSGNKRRETLDLELLLYHRGYGNAAELQTMGDLADAALLEYVDGTGGSLIGFGPGKRDTPRQLGDLADKEAICVRVLYTGVFWPQYLAAQSA